MIKPMLSLAILSTIVTTSYGSALTQEAYSTKAKEIINNTMNSCNGLPSDCHQLLKMYISKTASQKALLRGLDSQFTRAFAVTRSDTDSGARFIVEFADASNELRAHRARRLLRCRVGNLASFEESYASELTNVTQEVFLQRIGELSTKQMNNILIEEASHLAKETLRQIENQNSDDKKKE